MQISDWQAATRAAETAGSSPVVSRSSHVGMHLELSAQGYLAPELNQPDADPVALDVFGLGTLAYLLLANEPSATTRAELLARLSQDYGLRPPSMADSVSEFMDEVVQAATASQPAQRLASVAEFLELLEAVEDELTTPQAPSVHTEPAVDEVADLLEARLVTRSAAGGSFAGWAPGRPHGRSSPRGSAPTPNGMSC